MKAKELVTILQRYNPDWERQALLDIVDYVQRIMFNHPTVLSRAVGSDGLDPEYQDTDVVAGVLTIADAFSINKVYNEGASQPLDVLIQYNTVTFPSTFTSFPVRVEYYKKAASLTGEAIDLDVPEEYVDLLEMGCIARIEQMENGTADSWRVWKQRELRRFWFYANRDHVTLKDQQKRTNQRKLYGGY